MMDIKADGCASGIDTQALLGYLPKQRWFGAKDRALAGVEVVSAARLSHAGRSWLLTIVEVTFERGDPERYFLPLGEASAVSAPTSIIVGSDPERSLVDAGSDPDLIRAMLDGIRQELALAAGQDSIMFSPTAAWPVHALPDPSIRFPGAEQSNSSAVVEGYGVFKLYRRIQTGAISPEIEVARFLTERGFKNTAPLLAYVELVSQGESLDPAGLAVLFGWIANHGDGWDWALDRLRSNFRHGAPVATDEELLRGIERLGVRTAELHHALCPADSAPDAFTPEPLRSEDVALLRNRVRGEAEAMFRALETFRGAGSRAPAVDRLAELQDALLRRIDRALPGGRFGGMKTRFHGDYHLGQVLVAGDDFFIIDFEGEPRRSLADRRAKHSPLKDVAGMLRSFDYAAMSVVRDHPGASEQTAEAARRWRDRASEAFLSGYRGGIRGCASYPEDPSVADGLLELFTLEKAIYEVGYELANRPDWVGIPAGGIVDLLETAAPAQASSLTSAPQS